MSGGGAGASLVSVREAPLRHKRFVLQLRDAYWFDTAGYELSGTGRAVQIDTTGSYHQRGYPRADPGRLLPPGERNVARSLTVPVGTMVAQVQRMWAVFLAILIATIRTAIAA